MKLFDDMTPKEKLEHITKCIVLAHPNLCVVDLPVNVVNVWQRWIPYALDRLEKLENVMAAVRGLRVANGFDDVKNGEAFWVLNCKNYEELRTALEELDK